MKKYRRIIIAAALSLCFLTVVFAAAEDENDIVKELISRRTDILSGFYAGEIERERAVEIISSMESDHLMKKDIKNIESYFQTDIEQVKEYSFEDIIIRQSDDDIIRADVTMRWETEGIDGKETFTKTYNVICHKEKNEYKLAQFF